MDIEPWLWVGIWLTRLADLAVRVGLLRVATAKTEDPTEAEPDVDP